MRGGLFENGVAILQYTPNERRLIHRPFSLHQFLFSSKNSSSPVDLSRTITFHKIPRACRWNNVSSVRPVAPLLDSARTQLSVGKQSIHCNPNKTNPTWTTLALADPALAPRRSPPPTTRSTPEMDEPTDHSIRTHRHTYTSDGGSFSFHPTSANPTPAPNRRRRLPPPRLRARLHYAGARCACASVRSCCSRSARAELSLSRALARARRDFSWSLERERARVRPGNSFFFSFGLCFANPPLVRALLRILAGEAAGRMSCRALRWVWFAVFGCFWGFSSRDFYWGIMGVLFRGASVYWEGFGWI